MGYFLDSNAKYENTLPSGKRKDSFYSCRVKALEAGILRNKDGLSKKGWHKRSRDFSSWRASDRTPRASRRPQYACNARPAPARAMPPSMASLRCKHPARFSLQRKTQERKIPVRSEREILSEASVAVQNFRFHQQKAQQGGLLGFFTNGKLGRSLPELFS